MIPLALPIGPWVAVVGSRDYPRLDVVAWYVRHALPATAVVVSGGARGVDSTAEYEARARRLTVEVYRADWERLGKRAGIERNKTIVGRAQVVVAFWDGSSRGTMHTIQLARKSGKRVEVFQPHDRVTFHHLEGL